MLSDNKKLKKQKNMKIFEQSGIKFYVEPNYTVCINTIYGVVNFYPTVDKFKLNGKTYYGDAIDCLDFIEDKTVKDYTSTDVVFDYKDEIIAEFETMCKARGLDTRKVGKDSFGREFYTPSIQAMLNGWIARANLERDKRNKLFTFKKFFKKLFKTKK